MNSNELLTRRYGKLPLMTQEIILKKSLFEELEKKFSVIGIIEESECGEYIKVAIFTPTQQNL